MKKHQNKGFTLVEVIVVAVIVAVLAAVAIPLYTNYVNDARQGVVDNAAASAASFLGVVRNADATLIPAAGTYSTLTGPNSTSWIAPTGVSVTTTTNTVTASMTKSGKTTTSAAHSF